ncbi:MAG: TetR/AcrR family transcriptional regulator [Oscillospiraceae bacterium]|nr:TetR/AcrR family transcriptional regulator [Oscillospiraceae bacterium]
MSRENKKEAVAALHREQIMKAAEKLFLEKGFSQTTIDDISKSSEYSRRTIYAYYESKNDILHHIIEKGLQTLKTDIEKAVNRNDDFIRGYKAICIAMSKYQRECPFSADNINHANAANFDLKNLSDAEKHILRLGAEINTILATFIATGKEQGIVRQDIIPMLTVFILWSSITSFLSLAKTKGSFISKQFSVSESEFLEYGFKQLLNSILAVQI